MPVLCPAANRDIPNIRVRNIDSTRITAEFPKWTALQRWNTGRKKCYGSRSVAARRPPSGHGSDWSERPTAHRRAVTDDENPHGPSVTLGLACLARNLFIPM